MPRSTHDDPVPPLVGLDNRELCLLLEGSTEGTWIFEPELDRVAWSPKVFALLGYDEQRERFEDIDQIIHPEDREAHRAAVEQVMADGGEYRISVRIRTQSGSYKGIAVHGLLLPAREGAGPRLVGFLIDATSEIAAKESLARSAAQFRAFMDNCPAAVFLKRADGVHVYANEMAARILGVSVEDMIGHTTADLFPDAAAEALAEADRVALRSPHPITKSECFVGANGEVQHILDTKFQVPDIGSDSTLVGGFGLDITDRVLQEEEIRELDHRVRESQRLESIGLLAGGVAHDFNNVLMTVMGNVELALGERDTEPRTAYLNAALDRCKQAAALCSRLLTYAGRSPSTPRSLEPAKLLESAGELFDVSRSIGVHIDTEIEAELPAIHADEVQVRQVLMNLITNAAQAVTGRDGGRIRIQCCRWGDHDEREVLHSWAATGASEMVAFVVSDNGIGMDSERLQRIFEPFYTTNGAGRGLGMPTVLGIVKAHCGAIAVRSTAGEGTEVAVGFPVDRHARGAAAEPVQADDGRLDLSGKRLLVVDDQPEVLAVATRLIEQLGATVLGADSGAAALAVLEENGPIQLALVDVTMPGMSGVELARQIRGTYPATGIVLTSGYAEERGDDLGPEIAFLRKPYRLDGLKAALREGLGRSPA